VTLSPKTVVVRLAKPNLCHVNFENILCPACAKAKSTKEISFRNYSAYLCTECGLSYGVPEIPVTGSSFNNYSWTKEWTKDFPTHVERAKFSLAQKLKIIKTLTGYSVTSILDIGCGNGAFLEAAQEIGLYAEGTDIDLEHARFAIAKGLKATYCDILDYQTDRAFDLIHIKESFHLVTNPKEFINRVTELMGPRTVLYLDSTHADGLAARYRKRFVTPPRYGQLYPPLHNRSFKRQSLTYILEHAGLSIIQFVCFNRGDQLYCPTNSLSARQYLVNPLLNMFFLGGFVGCYATLKKTNEGRA